MHLVECVERDDVFVFSASKREALCLLGKLGGRVPIYGGKDSRCGVFMLV